MQATTKKLGLPSAISTCVGLIVATSCLLSLGRGMGMAGSSFVIAMAVVVVLNIFQAFTFTELHSLMPDVDGGLGQYTLVGLGPGPSILSNLSAYFIVNLLSCSVEISMCGMVLHELFLPMIPAPVIGIAFLLILLGVNMMGVDIFAKLQNAVVALLLLSFLGMGILSFFRLGTGAAIPDAQKMAPSVSGISGLVSMAGTAFWLFIGIEFVIPISKDLRRPKRDVPLAMIFGVCILFVLQSILGVGMTNYVDLTTLSTAEMPHMVFAQNLLGNAGSMWMGIVTLLAGISTANTVLGSVSKILCGMAQNEMLPRFFAKKNHRDVPYIGLLILSGGIGCIVVSGMAQSAGLSNMVLAASCFWLLSYILTNVTVLVLRRRYPNHPARNKKLTLLGIPQIVCILMDVFMIWNIAEGEERILIYQICAVFLVALVVYALVWVKLVKHKKLFAHMDLDEVNGLTEGSKPVLGGEPAPEKVPALVHTAPTPKL